MPMMLRPKLTRQAPLSFIAPGGELVHEVAGMERFRSWLPAILVVIGGLLIVIGLATSQFAVAIVGAILAGSGVIAREIQDLRP